MSSLNDVRCPILWRSDPAVARQKEGPTQDHAADFVVGGNDRLTPIALDAREHFALRCRPVLLFECFPGEVDRDLGVSGHEAAANDEPTFGRMKLE